MAKQRAGAKKLRRSSADKGYYARYKERYPGKLLRAKANREKRIEAARLNPEIGSPSQLRTRGIRMRRQPIQIMSCVSEIAGI